MTEILKPVSAEMQNQDDQEFAINKLLAEFHYAVESTAFNSEKYQQMLSALREYNPSFEPIRFASCSPKTAVLANVVAGIYAPLIHAYTGVLVKNISENNLPGVVIAPPRDAIPLANSMQMQAQLAGVRIHVEFPHVNRNIAGIANNQKMGDSKKSPYLGLLLDQTIQSLNGTDAATELETGIYGTTSLIMARAFKERGLRQYFPIKFYGLGPNLSFVHGVLSGGHEWLAEKAEANGLVDTKLISTLMVLLDTMEELGMEKMYQSVEKLQVDEQGKVKPVCVPVSEEELEIALVTNSVIKETAMNYNNIATDQVTSMLLGVHKLLDYSKCGFPFTLTQPIPPMDSKEEHFESIRSSNLFDYPKLTL